MSYVLHSEDMDSRRSGSALPRPVAVVGAGPP